MDATQKSERNNTMNKNELTAQCKDIAETFEAIADGAMMRCPECGEMFTTYEDTKCPYCGKELETDEYGCYDPDYEIDLYDYLEDTYDIKVTRCGIDRDAPIESVKICVAWGGPSIYIDTADCMVKLYWWADYAEYPINHEACGELERVIDELSEC